MHIILENTVSHMVHCRKAVTAFCHDRHIIFFITLCDPAVTLSVAYRQYIQRRNCQRRPAVRTLFATSLQKQRQSQLFAMTALSFSLSLCATPPLRYLLPIGNISKGGIVSGDPPSGLCLSRYCKSKGSHSFCHDRPIIFFIALCDPAVALSVAYRQYIQRRNCQRRPAALAVADFYNIDINVLESPCTSIIIVLFGAAHIYVNRDRSCHHTLACICRYSIAVADVVVLTDNVQL